MHSKERDKGLDRQGKASKKIENMTQVEHTGAGIVGSQRPETSPSLSFERCRGGGSLSTFDERRVQL
jgi:hypothetical protein